MQCHAVCQHTAHHCLQSGGECARPEHVRLLLDCAEVCQTCVNFLLRGSEVYHLISDLCAEVCERCAETSYRYGDETMTACAEMCRECAAVCRRLEPAEAVFE